MAKKNTPPAYEDSFRRLHPPPEFDPGRAESERRAASKRKRKMLIQESWMLESHLGGVLESVPNFHPVTALTDGFGQSAQAAPRTYGRRDHYQAMTGREDDPNGTLLRPEVAFEEGQPWVPVGDTAQVPFRCICHLEITYEGGQTATGSGWLAGPDTVVTAGHNVLNAEIRQWARDIRIVPGRNGTGSGPFGETFATFADALDGWKNGFDPASDLGVIKMADQSIGLATGWFGFAVFTDDDLRQAPLIQSAGYPAETKAYGTQWYDAGRAGRYSEAFISYRVDTEEGQSGAPVFFSNDEGQRWVVATHVYGRARSNLGQRVTEDIFGTISAWIA